MRKKVKLLLAAAAALGAAYAQAPDPDTTARHFIIMASIANLQQLNSGKLAAEKATRSDIRSFAKNIVTDDNVSEHQLLQLARAQGYQIPRAATETPATDYHLSKASGDDFDRLYIHAMAPGYRGTVMMFQAYATTGKDPEVKAFAQQMLPRLKENLAAITELNEKYKDLAAK